jgi:argininosuccinate lyase
MEVDRTMPAKLLGFSKVQESPIYVQNSRGKIGFAILNAISMVMFDLNKMASDMILFSMPEFGYFTIPKEFCTGSSIMPHKLNPDVLELMRAKYHQVVAASFGVMNTSSNLVSGYNRDIQLTKGYVMGSIETADSALRIASSIIKGLKVNKKRCKDAMTEELYSVKKAYDLSKEGVAFRDAYKEVAKEFVQ